MATRILLAATTLMLAAGCAGGGRLYHWGRYDDALYRHYRNPQDREGWVEGLATVIRDAEERSLRVPPGIHAEYGYALYEEGRFPEAIAYFQREREQWPESRDLMDKMIRNAELKGGKSATPAPGHGAAGALEQAR
jgi:hypothetical protein